MTFEFSKLSVNKKAAAIAFLLGLAAMFLGNPYQGAYAKVDAKELAVIVHSEIDHITVQELAEWIIKGKIDFRLLDLRPEKDFSEYHIPQSENIQITEILDKGIQRNEKIILYSDGGIHSAQAWFLLKAQKYKGVYILLGGLEEWKENILFPSLSMNASSEEKAMFEKQKEISKYFGGTPRSGNTEVAQANILMPKITSPAVTVSPSGGKKKKKEGC